MFISFEGTEGVGKTTLIRSIYADFIAQGKDVILTREPGNANGRADSFAIADSES